MRTIEYVAVTVLGLAAAWFIATSVATAVSSSLQKSTELFEVHQGK